MFDLFLCVLLNEDMYSVCDVLGYIFLCLYIGFIYYKWEEVFLFIFFVKILIVLLDNFFDWDMFYE